MVHPVGQSDRLQGRLSPFLPLPRLDLAVVKKRELHILQGGSPRQQIVRLENKSQFVVAQFCQLVLRKSRYVHPIELIHPGGGFVEASQDVEHRGFSGTTRPHDRHEITFADLQVNAFQGMDRHITNLEIFFEVAHLYQFLFHFVLFAPGRCGIKGLLAVGSSFLAVAWLLSSCKETTS
jgi:hypothetical protein